MDTVHLEQHKEKKILLSKKHKEHLEVFNYAADRVINSDFAKESSQRWIGATYLWNLKERPDNPDFFTFKSVNHNKTFTEALILNVRKLSQNNDDASIGNLAKTYDEMPIDNKYQTEFRTLRENLNNYLDSATIISVNGKPTCREILDTFVYGEFAHTSKKEREILELWKEQSPEWEMAYFHLQQILHEFISTVKAIHELNNMVIKDS
jgi:hypothetical protein